MENIEDVFDEDKPYRAPKPKRGVKTYLFIGILVALVLAIGTCGWSLVGLNQMSVERQAATKAFAESVLQSGIPQEDASIWADVAGFDAETLSEMQDALDHFQSGSEQVGETACNAQSMVRTNGPSGTFVFCSIPMTYDETKGRFDITWKQEAEDWKILRFVLHFEDLSSYYEAKAREKIELENMSDSMVPSVNLPETEIADD